MRGGSIIKQARRTAGLTQAELAERLATTRSAIARWESGRVSPTVESLSRIVEACGLSLHVSLHEPNDHDLGLALANLKLTPEQRMDKFMSAIRFARELRAGAPRR